MSWSIDSMIQSVTTETDVQLCLIKWIDFKIIRRMFNANMNIDRYLFCAIEFSCYNLNLELM